MKPTITDIQVDAAREMAKDRLGTVCVMCGAPFGPSVPRAKEKPDSCLECAVWLDGPYEDMGDA